LTWLTVKQVSELLDIGARAVRKAKSKYEYRHVDGVGRGGKQLQIALESLPQAAQDRYHGKEREQQDILHYTGKQRDEANEKAWIVVQYHQSGLSPDKFVEKFNAENPPEDAITKSKLFRWQREYKRNGVAGLIDQRGGHNRGEDTIPPDAWECFYALYMTQQKRSVRLCYDVTRLQYPDIPSVSAFERKVRQLPYNALVYYREGEKAFKDRCLPSMERSKLDIKSNDVWFSDHHRCDVFVKSADGKRIIRPWLTVFFDARSNKVVSALIRESDPNATAVKQCFRLGTETHGIPDEVYFDNGKDYRSKSFSKDYPMSLVNQLGIKAVYATKYHGQAKTVERFFRTFTDRFSRRFETYTGKDAKNRPECMRVSNNKILPLAPTVEEFRSLLNAYIEEYHQTPSYGIDLDGKCPNEVYYKNLHSKRMVSNLDALRLLCGNSEERTVHKNGISIKNNTYYHELLAHHVGEKITVIYDPENIDKVSIFNHELQAICVAYAKIRTPFRHTSEEDYNKAAKEKKQARAALRKYKPAREMELHEIIARNQILERDFSEFDTAAPIEQLTPQAIRNAEILQSTDQSLSTRRVRDEDSVSDTLMKFYESQA